MRGIIKIFGAMWSSPPTIRLIIFITLGADCQRQPLHSAYNIQCAVSDVQVTVLIIVSELASDNVAAVELAQLVTT